MDLEAYVLIELLHVLGLEHTFDDSDGDFYLSTDPQLSASPEQTTMSYRFPESGVYPKIFHLTTTTPCSKFGDLPQLMPTRSDTPSTDYFMRNLANIYFLESRGN